jgi:hypothetical protein
MTFTKLALPSAAPADTQELAIQRLEAAISPFDGTEAGGEFLAWLASLLKPISPDGDDEELRRITADIYKKFDGDEDGLRLVASWCSKGCNERSRSEIEKLWRSLKLALKKVVVAASSGSSVEIFTVADALPQANHNNGSIKSMPQQAPLARAGLNALDRYTINGQLEEIERRSIEQKPVLGKLALMGQATMFYAAPNSGKTLITLALAIEGIKAGLIDPSNLYFVNSDDSSTGVAEKLRIVEEYGIRMLAEAHQAFDSRDLLCILSHMIEHGAARNVIVILDTATKVVNVLDAAKTRAFTRVIRRFVLMGGTVIALAHANKALGPDGKPVYRGTTDIVNDFDCVYVLSHLKAGTGEKVIEFENKKRRGDVPLSVAFRYSAEAGISYHELLASVEEVDSSTLDEFKVIAAIKSDAELINAVAACIRAGINTKMLLADAVAERAGVSKRIAIRIIERYSGNEPAAHCWNFNIEVS